MSAFLKYKEYFGSAEVSFEDNCLYGEILFIRDKVTYEASSADELEVRFREAVDDYLAMCADLGREPQKPFTGSFNVRIPPALHEQAVKRARLCEVSLNEFVKLAIKDKVDAVANATVHHVHKHHYSYQVTIGGDDVVAAEDVQKAIWQINQTPAALQ